MIQEEIFSNRLNKFKKEISERNIELAIIGGPSNIYYFTSFRGGNNLIVRLDKDDKLVVYRLDYDRALENSYIKNVVTYTTYKVPLKSYEKVFIGKYEDLIIKEIKDSGVKKVGFSGIPVSVLNRIKQKITNLDFEDISDIIREMREIKDSYELEMIRKSTKIAEKALKRAVELAEPGITETEIAAEIEYVIRKEGAQTSFEPIVASGRNSAYPHFIPSLKKLEKGDFVVIDLGAKFNEYCSDMTRTIIVGKPTSKQKEIFKTVLESQTKSMDLVKEGVKASEIDKMARRVIEEKGYGPFYNHSTGHGVGIDIHEPPAVALGNDKPLKSNMVITVEPGIYIRGLGGVRIEDLLIVKKNGFEPLTTFEKELVL